MNHPLRCAVMDCKSPPMAGQLLCSDHKPKPLTLRERIAKGPRFQQDEDEDALCETCDSGQDGTRSGGVDKKTGLCRPCWRSWRWSVIREYEQP